MSLDMEDVSGVSIDVVSIIDTCGSVTSLDDGIISSGSVVVAGISSISLVFTTSIGLLCSSISGASAGINAL